ncbi:hypothetical protein [Piscirickettsia salmonis]|uniref:hypothetical protein n=1 Tax=Piscirickettsia salmonis TaxID=1238 RepID=UPI0010427600
MVLLQFEIFKILTYLGLLTPCLALLGSQRWYVAYTLSYRDIEELMRKRRYLGRYFAHPMMKNRRAKRDDYKPSAALITGHYVP